MISSSLAGFDGFSLRRFFFFVVIVMVVVVVVVFSAFVALGFLGTVTVVADASAVISSKPEVGRMNGAATPAISASSAGTDGASLAGNGARVVGTSNSFSTSLPVMDADLASTREKERFKNRACAPEVRRG